MTFRAKPRFDPLPLVLGAATALLLILGVLQYRWTGELSEAERARMRASLLARANQLARELDREVIRAFFWLQVDPGALREGGVTPFAERYERFLGRAAEPSIIKNVFLAQATENGGFRRLRYVPEERTFAPVEWPRAIAAALDRVEKEMSAGRPPRGPRHGPVELLEDGTPVIIAPAPRFDRPPGERFSAVRLAGLTVLELDREAIVTKLLPRLEQRHFPPDTQPAFELTVRRQDRPAEVVYRSPGTLPSAVADARVELLDLRPEELSEEDLRAVMPPGLTHGERRPPPRGEGRSFVARLPRGGRGGRDLRPGGHWSLEVGYQGGSVDALVEAARRRNLLVSFSVLLLLGAATALLASAAGRARRLAARQMEFVAAVSHELRTPVSVVCSAGENLADGVIEDRDAVLRYGALVRDEGRRLARLVEQVLDFAGTYAGKRSYRRERVAIGALVEQALAAAGPSLSEAGFKVEADLAPELPEVMGDSAALARALRNLLENAVKYGGDDRTVVVRGRREERRGRSLVRLEVEDHGLGIPASEQKHLFEPFWRGATATEREIRGSGLGLALVSSIVRAHGGEVSVKSEAGEGSVFTLALPAAEAAPVPIGATDERTHDIANPAG